MLNTLVSSLSLTRKPLQLGAQRVALGEVSVRPGLVAQSRLVEPVRGAAFVPRLGVKPRVLSAPGGTRPSGSDGPRRLIAPPPARRLDAVRVKYVPVAASAPPVGLTEALLGGVPPRQMSPLEYIPAPPPPPAEDGLVQGESAVRKAAMRRTYGGIWKRPSFKTHADARLFRQLCQVHELVRILPPEQLAKGVLGDSGRADIPDGIVRRELIADTIAVKSGPEGANASSARRAWRLLQQWAEKHGQAQTYGLPASRAAIAAIVRSEGLRARARAKGSQGGATVPKAIVTGFTFLRKACGLPIDEENPVVAAQTSVRISGVPKLTKHAASIPLCIQLHLEHLAGDRAPSVSRVMARCFLSGCFAHNTRMNDSLNEIFLADESISQTEIRAVTSTRSKDGLQLQLYALAEGWLGPWEWWPEHRDLMIARGHSFPDFESKPACRPDLALCLAPGVLPKHKALPTLRALCALAPLNMGRKEFDDLEITTHSPHGSGADMARFLGADHGFSESDARALGHWLRDRNAPQETPRPGRPNIPTGAPNAREDMQRRYTQGPGRLGERAEQLEVRWRVIRAVRAGLGRLNGEGWLALPRTLESWSALVDPVNEREA